MPKKASAETTLKSHEIARHVPQAIAGPLTSAIVTCGSDWTPPPDDLLTVLLIQPLDLLGWFVELSPHFFHVNAGAERTSCSRGHDHPDAGGLTQVR